jgi:D-amino-acid dehydrogenase
LLRTRATGFHIALHRLRAVLTEAGEVEADSAVIAAGAYSKQLAAVAGDRVPLETERGYHVVISDPGISPRYPVMPSDGKMAFAMTPAGLRIGGQVELAGLDAEPNWQRTDVLLAFVRKVYPDVPADLPPERVKLWMGHRPSLPDGLPCLGSASGCADIVHAFGHGHVGLTAGATTGRIVAEIISGRPVSVDLTPYSARRFA